jgi:hypothetical protein
MPSRACFRPLSRLDSNDLNCTRRVVVAPRGQSRAPSPLRPTQSAKVQGTDRHQRLRWRRRMGRTLKTPRGEHATRPSRTAHAARTQGNFVMTALFRRVCSEQPTPGVEIHTPPCGPRASVEPWRCPTPYKSIQTTAAGMPRRACCTRRPQAPRCDQGTRATSKQ